MVGVVVFVACMAVMAVLAKAVFLDADPTGMGAMLRQLRHEDGCALQHGGACDCERPHDFDGKELIELPDPLEAEFRRLEETVREREERERFEEMYRRALLSSWPESAEFVAKAYYKDMYLRNLSRRWRA